MDQPDQIVNERIIKLFVKMKLKKLSFFTKRMKLSSWNFEEQTIFLQLEN